MGIITDIRGMGDTVIRHITARRAAGWQWEGRIIARAWSPDFTDTRAMRLLAEEMGLSEMTPLQYSRDGVPMYTIPERVLRRYQHRLDTLALDRYVTHNVACNAGRAVLLNFVGNAASLTGVQYFAVGTGTGTPSSSDTQLFTELYRQVPTATLVSGNQMIITTTFSSAQGNGTYTEAGLCGDGATSSANTGQLFAHSPYVYNKTSSIVLTNQYTITLT